MEQCNFSPPPPPLPSLIYVNKQINKNDLERIRTLRELVKVFWNSAHTLHLLSPPFYRRLGASVSCSAQCYVQKKTCIDLFFPLINLFFPSCPQIMIQRGSVFKTCCLRLKNHRWVRVPSAHTHTQPTPTLLALQPPSSITSCLVYSSLARAPISFSYFHPASVINMEIRCTQQTVRAAPRTFTRRLSRPQALARGCRNGLPPP